MSTSTGPELWHSDPAFALHASLLVDQAQEPFPFTGQWPDIMWAPDVCNATLSYVACKVLEPDPAYTSRPESAHERFIKLSHLKCLVAKKHANSLGLPQEPEFLRGASWRLIAGKWVVQLRLPGGHEHEALVWQVVARFSKDKVDDKHLTSEQEQMHALLMQPVMSSNRAGYYCYLHRLLCWVFDGPPPGTGDSLLLQGPGGYNNAQHLCTGRKARCLAKKHLSWGTAQQISNVRGRANQAKKERNVKNLTPLW